jgi:hypothetical protein
MRRTAIPTVLVVLAALAISCPVLSYQYVPQELVDAFAGAQKVDLATSKISSVVTLRDVVKIPPPSDLALVKVFKRGSLPDVLKPVFAKPGICGVTIYGRYIAIIYTDMRKEYEDILRHELVHAYITMTSPKPLPFWFQEGSAVHFSTDKALKFYGRPSNDQVGVMVGKTVTLDPTYKQKLASFHFLIEQAGKPRFYAWYKNAVLTGDIDAQELLRSPSCTPLPQPATERKLPFWLIGLAVVVVVAVAIIGYLAYRQESGYI